MKEVGKLSETVNKERQIKFEISPRKHITEETQNTDVQNSAAIGLDVKEVNEENDFVDNDAEVQEYLNKLKSGKLKR